MGNPSCALADKKVAQNKKMYDIFFLKSIKLIIDKNHIL